MKYLIYKDVLYSDKAIKAWFKKRRDNSNKKKLPNTAVWFHTVTDQTDTEGCHNSAILSNFVLIL